MTKFFQRSNHAPFRAAVLVFLLLQILPASAQFSTDLNPHIKAEEPCQSIVYTALRKGYVSVNPHYSSGDELIFRCSYVSSNYQVSFASSFIERV